MRLHTKKRQEIAVGLISLFKSHLTEKPFTGVKVNYIQKDFLLDFFDNFDDNHLNDVRYIDDMIKDIEFRLSKDNIKN